MSFFPRRLRRVASTLLAAWAALAAPAAFAVDESDLLPVEQAFVLTADAVAPDRIEVRWVIADGYYLYRHRTDVQAVAPATAGKVRLPDGEPHEDEFFGKTETYRERLVATLPGVVANGGTVTLRVKYQGCADLGICYPPQTRTLTVAMPGARGDAPAPNLLGGGAAGTLPGLGNAPLPEEQAFRLDAVAIDGNTILMRFTPARGYYLYRDRNTFTVEGAGIRAGAPRWPKGVAHRDEHFGDVTVYFDPVEVPLPLVRSTRAAGAVTLRATFQGCQDKGICYPPMTRVLRVDVPAGVITPLAEADAAAAAVAAASAPVATPPGATPATPAATTGATAAAPAATSVTVRDDAGPAPTLALPLVLLFALLGGLILNVMPCVLPVLSLKVLGLVESNDGRARARAHAFAYTAGVLVSFVALGALVLALRGAGEALGWGFHLQNPLVVSVLALVMFVFGLSLSGVWTLTGGWMGAGQSLTERKGVAGDFFTGVLAVVVAAPCTAPFMFQAMGYAFTAHKGVALLVFAMLGLGLALPVLLVGLVPAVARLLPKPGAWMETFKQLLAFPLYLTAAWLLWVLAALRGADAVLYWSIAAVLLAFAAWTWNHGRMHGRRWALVACLIALVATAWPLREVHRLARPARADAALAAPTAASPDAVVSVPYSAQRLADLRASGRVVFVNMTADWCVSCKTNEKAVFARARFRDAIAAANAVYMVGDWTDVDPEITAFLKRHRAVGVPLYVVFPRDGGPGKVLPTLLTPGIVEEALQGASK